MNAPQFVRTLHIAMAFVVLAPAMALAQTAISGVVRDTSGAVLPGVTVEASSPVLIEKTRTVVTDGQGVYRIVDLRPGTYTVTFTLTGFSTVRREGLQLPDAFTATVNAELRVGALEETITVSGQSPLVDTRNVAQAEVLTNEVLEAVQAGRFVQNYVTYLPGVTGATLGFVGTDTRKFYIHGGREQDSIIAIDGFSENFVPGFSGNSSFYVNQAVIQETSVQTAGQPAEQQFGGIWINLIPKEGGNRFSGYFNGTYLNEGMVGTNLDDKLRAKGITEGDPTKIIVGAEPAGGGPIVRNKLWFYAGGRYYIVDRWRPFHYDTDPLDWVYTPDLSRPRQTTRLEEDDYNLRLTWQVTPRNKLLLYFDQQPHFFHRGRRAEPAPEAIADNTYWPNSVSNVTWKSPVTSRFLLEAGANVYLSGTDIRPTRDPGVSVEPYSIVPALESTTGIGFRAAGGVANSDAWQGARNNTWSGRASAAYITGSHAFKFGWQWRYGQRGSSNDDHNYSVTLTNGRPVSLQQVVKPYITDPRGRDGGLYLQDQWTRDRMTLNYGLRFDYLREWVPAIDLPAGPYVPARSFPKVDNVPNYKDLSPRFGIVFDLTGNGRTAIKGAVNRFVVNQLTGIAGRNAPLELTVSEVDRDWTDVNGNFVPDCALANPLANGECGQVSDLNFGKPNPRNLGYHPDLLTGWNVRNHNWEVSAQLQHELTPGVSADVGFFRRWYGGFVVQDNLAVEPSDYDHFCVTAPAHPELPGGGGYQVCDLYDVTPAKFGQVRNQWNDAKKYPGETAENWQGVDANISMRLPWGATFSGGMSTGRRHTINCAFIDLPTVQFCDTVEPWLAQVKFLGQTQLPWWGLELSGVYRDVPGATANADFRYTRAAVRSSLGRNLNTSGVTVRLVAPETNHLSRQRQVDLRAGKRITLDRYRFRASVDVYNVLNANSPQRVRARVNNTWPAPTQVQQPRMVQLTFTLDF